jgi:hypothetical protein
MAQNPDQPISGSSDPQSKGFRPLSAAGSPTARPSGRPELDDLEDDLSVSASELDELESRLNARLAGARFPMEADPEVPATAPAERPPVRPEPSASAAGEAARVPAAVFAPSASSEDDSVEVPAVRRRVKVAGRGLGAAEWAGLAGFGLIGLVAGGLFFKYLYDHRAPLRGPGAPLAFALPLAGEGLRLSGAEAGWRLREEGEKGAAAEVVVPTLRLTLESGHPSQGFVRVEFVDSDDKIRGDVLTLAVEGGRFKDSGRGEVIEEGGLTARLAGTVGFRSRALFTSYLAGDEVRWSVRLKDGPDPADGPWTDLGLAAIPNTQP